jgi:hypothetical protein
LSIREDIRAASRDAAARILALQPVRGRERLDAIADIIEGVAEAAQMWERVNRMELTLQRSPSANGCTIGTLLVDGVHECYICEDEIREVPGRPVSEWKIPGKTAIPAGRYRVKMTWSKRFQKMTQQILDVPGYEGVRIHAGNDAHDTEGCPLPGRRKTATGVLESVLACDALIPKIAKADQDGSEVWIDVRNPAPGVLS